MDQWVGSRKDGAFGGVRAHLEEYNPYVESSRSYMFVQLVDVPNDRWAKMGWRKAWTGARSIVTEAKWGGYVDFATFPALTGSNQYQVMQLNNQYIALVNGGSKKTWNAGVTVVSSRAQILGETNDNRDQMPGDLINVMNVTGAQYLGAGGGVWLPFSGTGLNTNTTYYGLAGTSTTAFNIWDKYCS